jgi:2,3-bisphosphoglycerate-independent phosphoglycerate mutase
MQAAHTPLVLIIRDGWGRNPNPEHDAFNAVHLARTPVADRIERQWPTTLIKTCGEDVGIPDGTMGNSEVGHQNIGAGRVVDQESVAITKACRAGLEHNAVLRETIERSRDRQSTMHLFCIASDAGVHGQLDHLFACVRAAKALGHARVALHLFTDGRDTGPFTGKGYLERVERELASIGLGRVASLCGRYFAMDRDNRWERVKLAYDALTARPASAGGTDTPRFPTAAAAIEHAYANPASDSQRGDEFVTPRIVGEPMPVRDADAVVFVNYRGDRPRELSAAFVFSDAKWADVTPSPDSGRHGFDRGRTLDLDYVLMTEYWDELLPFARVAFPKPPKMVNILGGYISSLGLTQFRCAETEKYPHVTFFFNDSRDEPFEGERRAIIQSPKVSTYDLQPQMSAEGVCRAVLDRLAAPDCEALIVVNFANGDMVGHTGKLDAAIVACETVDACTGRIIDAALARGGRLIVTADHGNAEQMFDPATGAPHTAHTLYDVPLTVVGRGLESRTLRGDYDRAGYFNPSVRARRGRLADIAPTALALMGLPVPPEMTGQNLLA